MRREYMTDSSGNCYGYKEIPIKEEDIYEAIEDIKKASYEEPEGKRVVDLEYVVNRLNKLI